MDEISSILNVGSKCHKFDTQFKTNQECFTQRTSNLTIYGEPDIKNCFILDKCMMLMIVWLSGFLLVNLQHENSYQ